jgi:small subunit ribosomal protein S6
MNKYELALVVSANVEEEVRNATIEQVKEFITRFGGTITDPGTCEKKRLAYEIKKMNEGFYSFIKFEAEATCPAEVESRLRIMENVLRFLILKDGE